MAEMKVSAGTILLFGVLAVGVYNSMQKRGMRQTNREYGNLALRITGVHMEGTDMIMTLKISNPNNIDVKVQSVVATMYANNQQIASINMFGDYTAKSNSEVTVPLLCKVISKNVFDQFREMVTTGRLAIVLSGTINLNNVALPISLKFSR